MAIVLTIEGSLAVLGYLYAHILSDKFWVGRLYVNDVTPTISSVYSDFTQAVDMNTIGMADAYNTPVTDTGVGAKMLADDFTFEMSADTSQTAYGWIVTDNDDKIIFAERFPSPIALADTGDKIKITDHVFKYHNG